MFKGTSSIYTKNLPFSIAMSVRGVTCWGVTWTFQLLNLPGFVVLGTLFGDAVHGYKVVPPFDS